MDANGNFEANSIKIANYIDDRMSPAEEEAFMQELGNDETLKQQFEDELHIRSLLANDDEISDSVALPMFQPADDHIRMIEKALEGDANNNRHHAPIVSLFSRYRNIAAIVLLMIAIAAITLIFTRNKNNNPSEIARTPVQQKPTPTNNDSLGNKQAPLLAQQANSDTVFRHFYKGYAAGEEDPAEVSKYYNDYKKGRYSNVIAASDADYRVMGLNNNSDKLKQYMYLYKGLSYLAGNKPSDAITQFDSVMKSALKTDVVFYNAKWYVTLAWLKKEDANKASAIAKEIAASSSPYKHKAELLVQELDKNK